ncbi:adenylate/guanylate cyclase domain-containing protein [Campylobacterota bacterium]|nr:adenylate/guanylate cyclase domain-containing protein [Campylobacterota bacterium]
MEYMQIAGAKAIAFDVVFSEPSVFAIGYESFLRDLRKDYPEISTARLDLRSDDEAFAAAARNFGRVVQALFVSSQTGAAKGWLDDANTPLFEPIGFALPDRAGDHADDHAGESALFPIAALRQSAGAIGSVSVKPDSDGFFRRAPLFTLFDDRAVASLGAAMLLVDGADRKIAYNAKNGEIIWGDRTFAARGEGSALLRFKGSIDRYIPYSAAAVLRSFRAHKEGGDPELLPEDFAGKFVFFGYYAAGLFDICATPISSVYPGMGIHITMLDNLLSNDFIRKTPAWFDYLLIALASVPIVILLTHFAARIALSLAAVAALFAAFAALAYYGYNLGWWIPMIAPLFGLMSAFIAALIFNFVNEGSQKRFIKAAFGQYLSPAVIERLLLDPNLLTLGGVRREITIFFSDIQGFTAISEKLDPSRLSEFLNDYLSMMSDIILDSGGTIDKYEGDAIIAFWNAPLAMDDHAFRALTAALACQKTLAARQEHFRAKYGFSLLTRIGLNTGYAVVGNMGSSKRFDYTMLGDSVNLAARLEGLNKQFGTYPMCSEAALAAAGRHGEVYGRKLAVVAVVGRAEAVTVYEPMTAEAYGKGYAKGYAKGAAVLAQFGTARDLFYRGEFGAALAIFRSNGQM